MAAAEPVASEPAPSIPAATPLPFPPVFSAPYAEDDAAIARRLLPGATLGAEAEARIDAHTRDLVSAIRHRPAGLGGVEELLRAYALSTKEGLALMELAEALLRVPDAATADRLIEDKLGQGDFAHADIHLDLKADTFLVSASAWSLGLAARVIQPGETPDNILASLVKRLGLPAVRAATRQAMRMMGNHFILGQTIEEALKHMNSPSGRLFRYSFDMLGEGARTQKDAERYFETYAHAIEAIGRVAGNRPLPDRPGISVKFSALHPRYEAVSRERVLAELVPRIIELARAAKAHDLAFTVDAEEADRLELSLDVIAAVAADPSLAGWEGFGLAVQAYQKRAEAVIDWTAELAEGLSRRMSVRLVKGAYWDTEIKRAQERGLAGYPVFTRKCMSDLNYVACAERLLALRPHLYPQFATHNALTVATVLERARESGAGHGFEFQRLHGMGEALYAHLIETDPSIACRTYAPVGDHRDLLAYLVRRLLENGANTSFVAVANDPAVPVDDLVKRPAAILGTAEEARHPRLPQPRDLYAPVRKNSRGIEFGDRAHLEALCASVQHTAGRRVHSAPIVDRQEQTGQQHAVISPIDSRTIVGFVTQTDTGTADAAMAAAGRGASAWGLLPADRRATALERAADLIEERRSLFIHLLQAEGGKTLDDAVAEVREAADFCRYYAAEGRRLFGAPAPLPGPTGEANTLALRPRGVFVAISPWNFPLAIFLGQVTAALMAGNAVVAKPAEQTPLIAAQAVRLLHEAGVPASALHLAPGDGSVGARLVAHPLVAGVVFTGSTEVARLIQRSLAEKDGPIVPLIAETGGINAMIVDATALPEQVSDDVVTSAFRSAGQRCSALRLLCLQEDIADATIAMIAGSARELKIGDPRDSSVHVGPVIDADAKARLDAYIGRMQQTATVHYADKAPAAGTFVAPHIIEIDSPSALTEEVFGPVLHVVRYKARDLDRLIDAIAATGYGLTLGVQSRIEGVVEHVVERLSIGNVYVNRNMIGAVVGVQPFGGSGLSGTGPKAGGPHYLPRFATEQTVTINTAAAGGNATLITMGE